MIQLQNTSHSTSVVLIIFLLEVSTYCFYGYLKCISTQNDFNLSDGIGLVVFISFKILLKLVDRNIYQFKVILVQH